MPAERPSFGEARPFDSLEGGVGREVLYRPQRYTAADVAPLAVALELTVGVTKVTCEVDNFSQNGIGVVWPASLPAPVEGAVYFGCVARFGGHPLYQGAVRVTNQRVVEGKPTAGVALTDDLLDIEAVMQLRDVAKWQAGDGASLAARDRPWWEPGHAEFKSVVSDLRLYLEESRARFESLERQLPWDVLHGTGENAARAQLIAGVRERFVRDVVALAERGDAAARGLSPESAKRLALYSQSQLDDLFMPAPFFHRARTKPLKYAGDYEMMRFIYDETFEGDSLYAKAMNLAGVSMAGSQLVRTRRDAFKEWLLARIAAVGPRGTLRIASIASGPAQEIFEILSEAHELPARLDVVLFDQDDRALGFAFRRLSRVVQARGERGVTIRYLHDTIRRLIVDPTLFVDFGPFDVIFCGGLFDYLKQPVAARLTAALYNNLSPGGSAVVGNVVPEMPSRWIMEHLLDWHLDYKSRHALVQFAAEGAPGAELTLLEEPSGWNPFVVATRPLG
ncbi:MAG: hypothetical protein R3A52_12105 [Polyangiales bacterium]